MQTPQLKVGRGRGLFEALLLLFLTPVPSRTLGTSGGLAAFIAITPRALDKRRLSWRSRRTLHVTQRSYARWRFSGAGLLVRSILAHPQRPTNERRRGRAREAGGGGAGLLPRVRR